MANIADWLPHLGTVAVGLAGIVATSRISRKSINSQAEAQERSLEHERSMLLRSERRTVYAEFLQSVESLRSLSQRDPESRWSVVGMYEEAIRERISKANWNEEDLHIAALVSRQIESDQEQDLHESLAAAGFTSRAQVLEAATKASAAAEKVRLVAGDEVRGSVDNLMPLLMAAVAVREDDDGLRSAWGHAESAASTLRQKMISELLIE